MSKDEKKRIDYSYVGMSNLVLQADRSLLPKRDKDFSGEVTSLWGKFNPKEFGSQAKSRDSKDSSKPKAPSNKKKSLDTFGHSSILAATQDFVGNVYAPQSKETKLAFEMLLAVVERILGDIPSDVVRSAVDGTLEILKQDTVKDLEKKVQLEELLSSGLNNEEFSNLLALSKKITDYHSTTEERDQGPDEHGVAVLFDEDEESDEMEEVQEVQYDEEEVQQVIKTANSKEVDQEEEGHDDFTTVLKPQTQDEKEDAKLSPSAIDAFWIQRTIGKLYDDAHLVQEKANICLQLLDSSKDLRQVENELMEIFDYTHFDLVKLLTRNRSMISWCTKLARVKNDQEKKQVIIQMKDMGLDEILMDLEIVPRKHVESMEVDSVVPDKETVDVTALLPPKQSLDLEELAFEQGGHLMSNKKVKLPQGSFKKTKKGYEEIHVPAPKPIIDEKEVLVPISSLPSWAQKAFKNATKLNRIQSKVFPMAFKEDDNLLLCAPTGAGKTNCAMLTILREVGKHINPETNVVDLDSFKIIYIAPMKALVAEMVGNFGRRLSAYGIKVAELTGDRQMTKDQIAETQVIITTPEKWDVITRKAHDRSYTRLVSLIIIDEIHLLHDDRGPVLESVISRTIRLVQSSQKLVRLVGLSATLPNYQDVATFLRVDPSRGLFFFDNSYRPCPLKQQYIGITEKKAIKRNNMMNEITYEKIMEEAGRNQVLVFCHSRKDTAKTAKAIRDLAIEKETISQILRTDASSREVLQAEAEGVKNGDLQDLLPYGFAIHHAGMSRVDRTLVEDLFADGHIQVLVSTATLAWGVNLPAHTVIIKGTQVYSPEKGRWMELSPQDVLQMLGRAGRPQFDTHGEGIIITTNSEMQFYLSLLNVQLPIESQFIAKLADHMNAEIVLGTIRSRQDAVDWLGYTYLYVRMLRNGSLYGVTVEDAEEDPYLIQKRIDIVHAAAIILDRCSLIKYDKKTGKFQGTELGRIASHYYISHKSMATYNQHLKPSMSQIDLFRVFALSDEFKFIPVREEEKIEIAKMIERVPIPIKESVDEPTAKINILLQAYISQLKLEGFALIADMVYVTQSAGRILRAIFEMCLKRGWAQSSYKALDLCKMVDKNMWLSLNPLRQVKGFPMEVIKKLERKEFPWDRYFDLSPQELGELANMAKAGPMIHKCVHQFPRLQLQAHVQPITRTLLRIELTITPDFEFDDEVSPSTESFWVMVEDGDSETILYSEIFQLKKAYSKEDHYLTFTVNMFEPLPPNYFVTLVSDRWLHCTARLPISFKHLILPEKYPPHTELLDLQPLPVSGLGQKEFERIYRDKISYFNPIHTQTFHSLYNSDDNTFIGASYGSDITICAEFALMRLWAKNLKSRAVYVAPFDVVVERRLVEWQEKFGTCLGGKNLVMLTGETAADLKLLESGDIIFTTAEKWDMLSRRWKQRKNVQTIGLFIVEDIHLLGGEIGPTLEVVVSRMRSISAQTDNKIRIVAMGVSLANARDIGEWIGATNQSIFNFSPSVKPVPLEIHIQGYNIPHFASLMLAMGKPTYNAICTHAGDKTAVVFVPNRKQCRLVAVDLLSYCFSDGDEKKFLRGSDSTIRPFIDKIEDSALSQTLELGVAFYHEALSKNDKYIVETMFKNNLIQVLIASRDVCWGLNIKSYLVVVMGAQYYEGKEHRYVDYPVTEVLCMMGGACNALPGETARCVLMCQSYKKDFYKKFLYEALPVESHLDHYLHDHFNAEIVTKTIENKQDAVDYLTWTFLYRRMALNPNYYNLPGVSYQHLSDHLSELVEQTLDDLANSKCITVEEDNVSPLNLGMIAAYYYINYVTIEAFSLSLRAKTKLRGLLEIISSAAEFEEIPIRHHEDGLLKRIYDRVPVKIDNANFNDPHLKTAILLQAHFSRIALTPDLESDQKLILGKIVRLLQACVDVVSSSGWLPPALSAMELCQMSVQALWDRDSPLKQVPHLSDETIKKLNAEGVEGIFDLMEIDDKKRMSILSLDNARLADVAKFVNQYPNIDVQFELESETVEAGDVVTVVVSLEREGDEEELLGPVIAPFYPFKKDEGWWLVVGNTVDKSLLAIKRTSFGVKATTKLQFNAPSTVGPLACKMYLMSDSYLGVDQEFDISLNITEAVGGSDDEMEENNEMEQD